MSRICRKAGCSRNIERRKKLTDIEVLMKDGCTRKEAEKHLKNGTNVIPDFEENFKIYMNEWAIGEEEQKEYRKMIETKHPMTDWGIVEAESNTYYIMYCM